MVCVTSLDPGYSAPENISKGRGFTKYIPQPLEARDGIQGGGAGSDNVIYVSVEERNDHGQAWRPAGELVAPPQPLEVNSRVQVGRRHSGVIRQTLWWDTAALIWMMRLCGSVHGDFFLASW